MHTRTHCFGVAPTDRCGPKTHTHTHHKSGELCSSRRLQRLHLPPIHRALQCKDMHAWICQKGRLLHFSPLLRLTAPLNRTNAAVSSRWNSVVVFEWINMLRIFSAMMQLKATAVSVVFCGRAIGCVSMLCKPNLSKLNTLPDDRLTSRKHIQRLLANSS